MRDAAGPTKSLTAPLVVGLLTLLGLAVRLGIGSESLFADELATYWIVTEKDLPGVFSTVHSNAEITPPLYFVLSWVAAQVGHAPEYIRGPSLLAGTALIPAVYLLGVRTVGRRAALLGAAITAFAPFAIYYSAEARAYALMMLMVVVSTVALLAAIDEGRRRWWILYAAASCAAVYSHYTCAFLLAAQLAWAVWAHPEARKPAIVANVGAAALFLPWASGFRNDLTSPTSEILSALSPFGPREVGSALAHWSIGYPYSSVSLTRVPGVPALVLGGLALALGVVGGVRGARDRGLALPARGNRVVLLVLLALAVPVGEAVASAASTNIFGVRNLAASWPALALAASALVVAAGPRLRVAAAAMAVAAGGLGAMAMFDSQNRRPDYQAAADVVNRATTQGDVVIDLTGVISPGPLTPLDTTLPVGRLVVRGGAPAERDYPFTVFDPIVRIEEAARTAGAAARGRPIYVVRALVPTAEAFARRRRAIEAGVSIRGYRRVARRRFPGILTASVELYMPIRRPAR